MKSGDEITLGALRREHVRVSRIAVKAKAELDEYMGIHDELFAIHRELNEIIQSNKHGESVLKQLGALKKREVRTGRILAKDFIKLSDRQFKTEWEASQVAQEIGRIEFRLSIRNAHP